MSSPNPSSSLETRLRFMQLNAENLFLYIDKHDGEDLTQLDEKQWQQLSIANVKNKSLRKTNWLAESILQQDPDIVFLNEVGGRDSLEVFNLHFLKSNFTCHLKEGNSERGIDIGYLVNKRVQLKPLLLSHKNRSLNFNYLHELQAKKQVPSHRFSRDVAELRLFSGNQLVLVILGVHLKSKLDPQGIDPQGTRRRQAEFETLLKIYQDISEETAGNIPIIVSGDFNGQARASEPDPEFLKIRQTDLIDIFDIAGLPAEERTTQLQILNGAPPVARQIDYIFVSHHLHASLVKDSAKVVHFKNDLGLEISDIQTPTQRYELPSDHFPIQVDIKIKKA